ncbi:NAD(P)-dependent oxidoreductase [Actinomadura sp. 7K534]|uniref:NAD-dependent epimerase/dehydratase family protein n=1 Tax=Actinomadura sp. 7K534 TaxID=2530366 RepID=UPI00104BFE81|nr:NAD(P)-dependent oxidoreductase [Actinomadura sp. 7K534]TDB92616.1 NAD(P)-dependent oxidoreductase [Actinomadura sp. 7K534]
MRIAVTGASGFVGGAVCRRLAADGAAVFAYGRRASVDAAHLGGAVYRSWDVTRGPLADAPQVDAVVHCAGSVTDWGPAAGLFAANLTGTRSVLAAFPGARFVHVSTASVYDPFRPSVMATEDEAPVRRYMNAYGASKAAAERAVLAAPGTIVLRPHAVYGPGDATLLPRVLSAVRGPVLTAAGTGRQRISLTSIGNLVQACVLAATGPAASGVFNVADAAPVTIDDAFREILRERGVRARPVYVPAAVARPLAALAEGAFLLANRPEPPRITRYAISHLAVERTLDITAAREVLGYDPRPTTFAGAAGW